MIQGMAFRLPSGFSFTVYELKRSTWSFFFDNTPPGNYPNFYTAKDAINSAIKESGLTREEYIKFLEREANMLMLSLLVLKKQDDK